MRPTDISKTIRNRVGNEAIHLQAFLTPREGWSANCSTGCPRGSCYWRTTDWSDWQIQGPLPKRPLSSERQTHRYTRPLEKSKQKTDSVAQRLNVRLAFRTISINQHGGLSFWMTWQLAFLHLITENHRHSLHASFFHILISLLLTQSNI